MNHSALASLLGICLLFTNMVHVRASEAKDAAIVIPGEFSWSEEFAAKEVRRYIYVCTGHLLPITSTLDARKAAVARILVTRKDRPVLAQLLPPEDVQNLPPQGYLLKTLDRQRTAPLPPPWNRGDLLVAVGGGDAGTLYAAYRLAESFGVRFYLHSDVIPDKRTAWRLPVLNEVWKPLFETRGIQPFHDFPEGPDWWNRDDYLAVIGQLPKLRMNFIGLHTYPEDRPNAEPTVWIGPESELSGQGQVKASYPSSYQNTLRGNWGYLEKRTGDFTFGSDCLFERDDFGPDVMIGNMPGPSEANQCNEVINGTAAMLNSAFTFAHQVGVKTCVGTETPLVIPKRLQERLVAAGKQASDLATIQELYAGIFRRIAQAYPLDYFWFWTPEGWTWSGTKEEEVRSTTNDLFAAIAAYRKVQPPFALATCGWVLGPLQDRALFDRALPKDIAVSCINREVGKTPVEPSFAEVQGRSKWAIPWMEDDPALTSPQLWVGRMRRDAADAFRYGCDGLLGIHWRTRVLAPNVAALAQAAWNQQPWLDSYKAASPAPEPTRESGPVGGSQAAFPNNAISGTDDPVLYQTVRYNLSAYHLPATNGSCRVVLKFSEPHYTAAGKRVFDVKLQGRLVLTNLDIFAQAGENKALDFSFDKVMVTNGWVDVDFIPRVEYPSIAAIDIQGDAFKTRVNCGGPAYRDYAADAPGVDALPQVYADTSDFYADWAAHEFGKEAGAVASGIFSSVDCKLPVPSVWTDGPGGIQPDRRSWQEVGSQYSFVDAFAALKPQVKGAGNAERFDYWLNTLEYLRAIARVNCAWGEFDRAMEKVRTGKDTEARKRLARDIAVPARRNLVHLAGELYDHLLATVSTPGELGTVANWEQHNLPILLNKPGQELTSILQEPLSADLQPRKTYEGPTRIVVPTKRTSLANGESLQLKVIILSDQPPRKAILFHRTLGTGSFTKIPLQHIARGVYRADLPPADGTDLEYYIRVEPIAGKPVLYPPTAPALNQTLVTYRANR